MFSTAYRRDLTVTVTVVLLLAGVLVGIHGPSELSPNLASLWFIVTAFSLFAAGPFTGWILATLGGAFFTALWSLIPLTFFSIWPAVRAANSTTSVSRRVKLALAGSVWLFSGFFYAVLIWT